MFGRNKSSLCAQTSVFYPNCEKKSMKKIRVIDFFITFANDTTLAHAVSMHGESL